MAINLGSIRKFGLGIALAAGLGLPGFAGFTAMAASASPLLNDPVIENPGLLPTNPFYFLKRFRRLTQRTITLSSLKKAELELDILNQKAAEIKRLLEIIGEDADAVLGTTAFYEESLGRLANYLAAIRENSDRQATDQLLTKLLETGLKHFMLFDELETKKEILIVERLEKLQAKLAELVAGAISRLDNSGNFGGRLDKVLKKYSGDLNELMLLAMSVNRLAEKSESNSWLMNQLLGAEENLFLETQSFIEGNELENSLAEIFDLLPGNKLRQVAVIDNLREYLSAPEAKNQLSIIRQRLLDNAKEKRALSKTDAEKMIAEASRLTKALAEKMYDEDLPAKSNALRSLLSRAEFNLNQARESFNAGHYGEAFGQATAAAAAARNGLRHQQLELAADLKKLKNDYDALIQEAGKNGLTGETAPALFELLAAAEKLIIKVADLSDEKSPSPDKINAALRDAKLFLLKARHALKSLMKEVEKLAEHKKSSQPLIERVLQNRSQE